MDPSTVQDDADFQAWQPPFDFNDISFDPFFCNDYQGFQDQIDFNISLEGTTATPEWSTGVQNILVDVHIPTQQDFLFPPAGQVNDAPVSQHPPFNSPLQMVSPSTSNDLPWTPSSTSWDFLLSGSSPVSETFHALPTTSSQFLMQPALLYQQQLLFEQHIWGPMAAPNESLSAIPQQAVTPASQRTHSSPGSLESHAHKTGHGKPNARERRRIEKPENCLVPGCHRSFQFQGDLKKHIGAKHREQALLYGVVPEWHLCKKMGCPQSMPRGKWKGYARGDHLIRHMIGKHGRPSQKRTRKK